MRMTKETDTRRSRKMTEENDKKWKNHQVDKKGTEWEWKRERTIRLKEEKDDEKEQIEFYTNSK